MVNIIPFLVFLFILLINKKYVGRWFCLSNYIHLLYVISTFCFFLQQLIWNQRSYNIEALSLIVFSNVLLVWPLAKLEKKMGKDIPLTTINNQKLKWFCLFIVSISFFSIVFFGVNLRAFFSVDIVALRASHGGLYQGGTILSKIACFGAYLFPVSIYLYFYNLVKKQLPKLYTNLLLISSLSFFIYGLNVGGRDGIVLWFLTFVGFFFFFNMYLDKESIRKNVRTLFLIGGVGLTILVFISIMRFSDSDKGTLWAMVDYMGQCLGNLSQNIDAFYRIGQKPMDASGTFELLYYVNDFVFGFEHTRHERFGMSYFEVTFITNSGFTPFAFCYYVGSIYPLIASIWGYLLFIFCVFIVVNRNSIIINGRVSSIRMLVAVSWYTILISGVFYFYYGTLIGNFFLLFVLFIPLFLKK